MRIFVTGASGFVGSAVVRELLAAGHSVVGLARSDAAAQVVAASGAEVLRGSLQDLESLKRGAAAADGVVHTAFNHDFSRFAENAADERRAIEALGDALQGTHRPLIVTSGLAFLTLGRLATEADAGALGANPNPRVAMEPLALSLAERGVRVAVLRLSPSVHGDGDKGFVPMLGALAREKGASAYIGEGQNRWPAVHRLDAARLYRLALEKGTAGAVYHAAADEGVPFRAIAEAIGRQLGVPVVAKAPEEVAEHFGGFSLFAAIDCPSSSQRTREALGWEPREADLLTDIGRPSYFAAR